MKEILGIALISFICLTGCALTKEHIALDYAPQQNIDPIRGSEKINLEINVKDFRKMKDKVSYKKNGYGMELAEIISDKDVVDLVRDSIKTELSNRGFNTNGNDVQVNIELIKFFNDFKPGFFAGDATGEVIMSAQVKKSGGNIIYNKSITGEYTEQNIQLMTGNNAKLALEGALKDAISKLVNDTEFIRALMQSKT
jgi:uncharacterized lipoprotein YajG